ncbi:hypothetical protein [Bizionia myxarmorum]|uniref:Lipoprotein n=1 Tax=Bizionia myxarmorum TaxID=291186 RepID=A0A5D0R5F7_9FLAO|nr:hypothetical protein [Bizionia myxarmorum]TYB75774.1 hypothetical protein ES674_13180 [Bizionia myxarmorum]
MKLKAILPLVIILVLAISCTTTVCKNTSSILNSNEPETGIYQQELVKEIDRIGARNLTYLLNSFNKQNGEESLTIDVQGDGLCAEATLIVKDWSGLEEIKRTKGVSYLGAELRGLTFDIINNTDSVDFIYKNVEAVVD